jgi:predicted phosphoribosyltransferase
MRGFSSILRAEKESFMRFTDRQDAGRQLAEALAKYRGSDVIVYALPRGGVIPGFEIAQALGAPLDLIITRKIGHPYQPEYAIAAVAEDGHMIGTAGELEAMDTRWLEEEKKRQQKEARRRRETYLGEREAMPVEGKVAILVDDGIATGLTMRVGILELKHRHPKKIVVAVPVVPASTADLIRSEADELVALDIPTDGQYLGAVGAYYDEFQPVEDEQVISLINRREQETKNA